MHGRRRVPGGGGPSCALGRRRLRAVVAPTTALHFVVRRAVGRGWNSTAMRMWPALHLTAGRSTRRRPRSPIRIHLAFPDFLRTFQAGQQPPTEIRLYAVLSRSHSPAPGTCLRVCRARSTRMPWRSRCGLESRPEAPRKAAGPPATLLVYDHVDVIQQGGEFGGGGGGVRGGDGGMEPRLDPASLGDEDSSDTGRKVLELPQEVVGRSRDVDQYDRGSLGESGDRVLPHIVIDADDRHARSEHPPTPSRSLVSYPCHVVDVGDDHSFAGFGSVRSDESDNHMGLRP